jgi:hypothetical protein
MPLFLIPYMLRAVRLITIFKQHKEYVLKKRRNGVVAFKRIESRFCVSETTLAFWMIFVILLLMAFFTYNILEDYKYSNLIP